MTKTTLTESMCEQVMGALASKLDLLTDGCDVAFDAAPTDDEGAAVAEVKRALVKLLGKPRTRAALAEVVTMIGQVLCWQVEASEDEQDPTACPGCGCKPGDGRTEGCKHPGGCGFYE